MQEMHFDNFTYAGTEKNFKMTDEKQGELEDINQTGASVTQMTL
jgi:hypothetical protein